MVRQSAVHADVGQAAEPILRRVQRWSPGDAIAWRCRIRTPWGAKDDISYVFPMTVVSDTDDELVLLRRPGHVAKRRNAELGERPRMRPITRGWRDGWSDDVWRMGSRVLITKRPLDQHAISLFWHDATNEFAHWYIDLTSPLRRTSSGFDFVENGLDVVVAPDMSTWRWKDDRELEWEVEHGLFTRAEADELYREGERAVDRLRRERVQFERWITWRPDPSWPLAILPDGWEEL